MFRKRAFALAGISTFIFAQAHAADMPSSLPPVVQMPTLIEEYASGWYLRGDLGYRLNQVGDVLATGSQNLTSNRIDDAFMFGIGAGYKSRWFRTDVTLDYALASKYTGTFSTPADTSAKVDAFTAMFNGYVDMGTWYGVTPYVGAGIGAANLRMTEVSAPSALYTVDASEGNKWNLAWAGMAGFSYCITPTWLVDIGYRYVNLGKPISASDSSGRTIQFNDMTAHELRVGARWAL